MSIGEGSVGHHTSKLDQWINRRRWVGAFAAVVACSALVDRRGL